jgi:hypothetical protein
MFLQKFTLCQQRNRKSPKTKRDVAGNVSKYIYSTFPRESLPSAMRGREVERGNLRTRCDALSVVEVSEKLPNRDFSVSIVSPFETFYA